jgi:hypothetical protein
MWWYKVNTQILRNDQMQKMLVLEIQRNVNVFWFFKILDKLAWGSEEVLAYAFLLTATSNMSVHLVSIK